MSDPSMRRLTNVGGEQRGGDAHNPTASTQAIPAATRSRRVSVPARRRILAFMWLHNSPTRFDDGSELLPPSVTGVHPRTFADDEEYQKYDWYRDDRVYVWPYDGPNPLEVLDTYAWTSSGYFLYEVQPEDIEADCDLVAGPLGSACCRSAVVLRCLFNPYTDVPPLRWVRLDITTVPAEPSYRDGSREWAKDVDWVLVNERALTLLDRGHFGDLAKLEEIAADMSDTDRWALHTLQVEPVGGTPEGVINGIHRMEAMRAQGVRYTVALE